jgi:hypothetical protein
MSNGRRKMRLSACDRHYATDPNEGRIVMTNKPYAFVSLSFAAASLVALSGCEPGPAGSTVTVNYSQVGACNGYASGSGISAKRPNSAFVVFEIESFDTTKSGVDFRFVPSRLFVNLDPEKETWGSSLVAGKYYASSDKRFAEPLGVPPIEPVKAPARGTTELHRLAFIAVQTTGANGAADANKISYHLFYDPETGKEGVGSIPDPHVEFVKTNETRTVWPEIDDCSNLEIKSKS